MEPEREDDIAPALRRWAFWIVIAVAIPSALFFKATIRREGTPGLLALFLVVAFAIAAIAVIYSPEVQAKKIKNPLKKARDERRELDIT